MGVIVGVQEAVTLKTWVNVEVGLRVVVAVGEGVEVVVSEKTTVGVRVKVEVGLKVRVPVGVALHTRVGVALFVGKAVEVGVNVADLDVMVYFWVGSALRFESGYKGESRREAYRRGRAD